MEQKHLYSVWRNDKGDDSLICLDETAKTCAELMGIQRNSFYRIVNTAHSESKKWKIIKTVEREEDFMNKLTIIGNLVKDPELRTTASGINVCSFTVAVNRKKKGDGTEADYFRVSAWRGLADVCKQYLTKGAKVCVEGSVAVSVNESNGKTYANLDVVATEVEFL